MVQQFVAYVYELFHGLQDTPLYEDTIYPQIGAALLACTLVCVAVFYYGFGWTTARYNMVRHWVVALVLNSAISMVIVLAVGQSAFGGWDIPAPLFTLMLIQGLYAAVFFVVLSAVMKWGSRHSPDTPV
jgi:hypothetical protein